MRGIVLAWFGLGSKNRVRQIYSGINSKFTPVEFCRAYFARGGVVLAWFGSVWAVKIAYARFTPNYTIRLRQFTPE